MKKKKGVENMSKKLTKLYNMRRSRERACRAAAKTQSLCFKMLS